MATCLIRDLATEFDDEGVPQPLEGRSIRCRPVEFPAFVEGVEELEGIPRVSTSDSDGYWQHELEYGAGLDPSDLNYEITLHNGEKWRGEVPEVAGPLTIQDLRDDHGWTRSEEDDDTDPGLGYDQVYDDGVASTQTKKLNFAAGIIAEYDSVNGRTNAYLGDRTVASGAIVANTLTKVSATANRHSQLATSDGGSKVTGVALEAGADATTFKHGCVQGEVYPVKTDGTAVALGDRVMPSTTSAGRVRPLAGSGEPIGIAEQAAAAVADTVINVRFMGSSAATASTETLQATYDASASGKVIVDSTRGAVWVKDASTPLAASLIRVSNNAESATYLDVLAAGTTLGNTSSTVTSAGDLINTSTRRYNRRTATASPVTVSATDHVIGINLSVAGAVAVTLPASPATGRMVTIKDEKGDATTNNITITPAAGTIDGVATKKIRVAYGAVVLLYNGTQWVSLAEGKRLKEFWAREWGVKADGPLGTNDGPALEAMFDAAAAQGGICYIPGPCKISTLCEFNLAGYPVVIVGEADEESAGPPCFIPQTGTGVNCLKINGTTGFAGGDLITLANLSISAQHELDLCRSNNALFIGSCAATLQNVVIDEITSTDSVIYLLGCKTRIEGLEVFGCTAQNCVFMDNPRSSSVRDSAVYGAVIADTTYLFRARGPGSLGTRDTSLLFENIYMAEGDRHWWGIYVEQGAASNVEIKGCHRQGPSTGSNRKSLGFHVSTAKTVKVSGCTGYASTSYNGGGSDGVTWIWMQFASCGAVEIENCRSIEEASGIAKITADSACSFVRMRNVDGLQAGRANLDATYSVWEKDGIDAYVMKCNGTTVANTLGKIGTTAKRCMAMATTDPVSNCIGVILDAASDAGYVRIATKPGTLLKVKSDGAGAVAINDAIEPSALTAGRVKVLPGAGPYLLRAHETAAASADAEFQAIYLGQVAQ